MIEKFILKRLQDIEQNARQTLCDIAFIRGFCEGMETIADDIPLSNEPKSLKEGAKDD